MKSWYTRSRLSGLVLAVVGGLVLAAGAAPAEARSVTYTFTGTLDAPPEPFAGLLTGNAFTGSYTLDLDASSIGGGFYLGAVTDLNFSVAGYDGASSSASLLLDGTFDQYVVSSYAVTAPVLGGGWVLTGATFTLDDVDVALLQDVASLSQTAILNSSLFSTGTFELNFIWDGLQGPYTSGEAASLTGAIESFAVVPTPAAALAGLGLLGVLGLARGVRRASRGGA